MLATHKKQRRRKDAKTRPVTAGNAVLSRLNRRTSSVSRLSPMLRPA
jgi:hypothetical protein